MFFSFFSQGSVGASETDESCESLHKHAASISAAELLPIVNKIREQLVQKKSSFGALTFDDIPQLATDVERNAALFDKLP